jgi:hypothetical protein
MKFRCDDIRRAGQKGFKLVVTLPASQKVTSSAFSTVLSVFMPSSRCADCATVHKGMLHQ